MSNPLSGYGQFTGHPLISSINGVDADDATQQLPLGSVIKDIVGNSFRYIKANEAVTKGDVVTSVVRAAWDSTIVVDGATAATDTLIHIDTVATAMTKNQYAGYYISVATAAGVGRAVQIKSHDAIAAAGEGDIHLVQTCQEIFANNAVLLIHNPYLMELTDAATEIIEGVAVNDITSGQFGFIQVGGYVPVVKVGHSTSVATTLNETLTPVAANPGAVQGMAGVLEANLHEGLNSPLVALRVVALNTTGFIEAYIKYG